MKRFTPKQIEAVLREQLGEAIHTSLRKAGDSSQSTAAWLAISDMSDAEWNGVLDFAIHGMMMAFGLEETT